MRIRQNFNSKVQEVLQETGEEIEKIPKMPALDCAKAALEKSIKFFTERQKLIKLTDWSD